MAVYLFEDHCESYAIWKARGERQRTVVHLDAHLDLSTDGFPESYLQGLRSCTSRASIEQYRNRSAIGYGGLHCGNYLYPAILEGIVARLFWVVPPFLPRESDLLAFARDELPRWYDMPLRDFTSLRLDERGAVQGEMLGIPFTMARIEQLPPLDEVVVLDIDVDYYLGPRELMFESPASTLNALSPLKWDVATVAFSVNGGYLPLEHRIYGEILAARLNGPDARLDALADALREADEWRADGEVERAHARYRELLPQAEHAIRYKLHGECDDPVYAWHPINQGCSLMRQQRYSEARQALQQSDDRLTAQFLLGTVEKRAGHPRQAAAIWRRLLQQNTADDVTTAHIWNAIGEAEQTPEGFAEAVRLQPQHARYWQNYGRALQSAGDYPGAAAAYRKSLRLGPLRRTALDVALWLMEVYVALGQPLFAESELRRITSLDPGGFHSVQGRLLLSQAATSIQPRT